MITDSIIASVRGPLVPAAPAAASPPHTRIELVPAFPVGRKGRHFGTDSIHD